MTKRTAKAKPAPDLPPPSKREVEAIAAASERTTTKRPPVSIAWDRSTNPKVVSPHSDDEGHSVRLLNALGTRSHDALAVGLGVLEWSVRPGKTKRGESAAPLNAALAMIEAIAPENETEGALAMQMAACHALTMEMLGRTRHAEYIDHVQTYGGLAVKLQRTFAAQIEAMTKLRGGGKQQVEVRHVYINGNAVIGDVHPAGGGGGAQNLHQPHAQSLTHAPGAPVAPVWSQDAARDALPVTGDQGTEAMPDARGE